MCYIGDVRIRFYNNLIFFVPNNMYYEISHDWKQGIASTSLDVSERKEIDQLILK